LYGQLPKLPLIAKIAEIEKQKLEPQRTRRNTEEKRDRETKIPSQMRGEGLNIRKAKTVKPRRTQQMNADGNNAEQDGLTVRFQPIRR
jgi:hypothetical protein